jgi:glycosyltransferase involved in cell wall biosynthesis
MDKHQHRTCLIVSLGPVPTPQYTTIEGTGMRAWGLAKGLLKNGVDVTVAVKADFPQELKSHESVKLVNWQADQEFVDMMNGFDAVIVSYCAGSDSVFIADNIADSVQLILDAYVPIYVEVSAREAKDLESDYIHYMADVARYNHVLKRGDYFLCASQTQKIYYTGVLSALGIINPRSYREDRLIIAPFGIHNLPAKATHNPYKKLGIKDSDFLVIWFGGLYPWFKVDEFLDAIKELSANQKIKFVIVGGKNPFNPNPDLARQYDKAVAFAKKEKIINKGLSFVDWVDFEDRINWYKRANVVISINNPGEENTFSWRTRVMDYVWGELPILTNGGDPLSEQLLEANAAVRLEALSSKSIVTAINNMIEHPDATEQTKRSLIKLKETYYWDKLVAPINSVITQGLKPSMDEATYRDKLGVAEPSTENIPEEFDSPINPRKPIALARRAVSHARRKGVKRSAHLAYKVAKTQFKKRVLKDTTRKYVFISHPIDNTGAPMVLVRMVKEYAQKYGSKNIRVIAPGILPHILKDLKSAGVSVEKAATGLNDRMIALQLGLNKDDFVLINTLAIYPNYRGYILRALASGQLNHAYWFVHEDTHQIPLVAADMMDPQEYETAAKLANDDKLSLLVPSKKIKLDYEKLWGVNNVNVIPLNVDVPDQYKVKRPALDYAKINFMLSGSPSDARKGQLLALSAFYYFTKNFYEKDPKKYRPFSLTLVGIGDDYVSQQIKTIGRSFMKKNLVIHPSVPHEEALKITADCNAVICCSLNETFGLYVAEGMFMGHLVLRNNSAGMAEQLKDGVNGHFVDGEDIEQFAGVIEKILNTDTSNAQLQSMGAASQRMIGPYAKNKYTVIEGVSNAGKKRT